MIGLLEELRRFGVREGVVKAIERVDRAGFLPEGMKASAYANAPLPIGHAQTISQPLMVAEMTQLLDVREGQNILEIGAGSGWQAAILKELVGNGKVTSVERISALVGFAERNLEQAGYEVEVVMGDGTLGWPAGGPYDRIMVTAGAPKVPEPLLEQLVLAGRMVIPVGTEWMQDLLLVEKAAKGPVISHHGGCVFVKLIGKEGWPG